MNKNIRRTLSLTLSTIITGSSLGACAQPLKDDVEDNLIQTCISTNLMDNNSVSITRNQQFIEAIKEQAMLRIKEEEERLRRIKEEEERLFRIQMEEENRKNNVRVNLDNVLEPSGITSEELGQVFNLMNKPEMVNISWAIVEVENITGINALFLAGLISNESSYGTSYKAINQNNYTGFGAYNSKTRGSSFSSPYECILETAEWLKQEYLSPDGVYFYGYSTYHINTRYCLTENGTATDYNWSSIINNISKTIESYYHNYIK